MEDKQYIICVNHVVNLPIWSYVILNADNLKLVCFCIISCLCIFCKRMKMDCVLSDIDDILRL